MTPLLCVVVGGVFSAGVYLLLQRNAVRLLLGLVLIGQAVNLLIFTAGGLTRGHPPLIPPGETSLAEPYANPLPQALILTAIVIGLGFQAFVLALVRRTTATAGTADVNHMRTSEQ